MATEEQTPKDTCDVHGGGMRNSVRPVAPGEWPRASLAVDVSAHTPVVIQGPTVIGDSDPYNSTQAVNNAFNSRKLAGQLAPMDSSSVVPAPVVPDGTQVEVRRAEIVRPVEQLATPDVPIKLDPPPPIDFK